MIVGWVEISLDLGECRSLKEKRSVIRPIIERIRRRGISCAEVGDHDIWNRSRIGITVVSASSGVVEAELRGALDLCIERNPGKVEIVAEDRIRPE